MGRKKVAQFILIVHSGDITLRGFSLSFMRHKRNKIKWNKNYAILGRKPHDRFYYITGSIFYLIFHSGDITLRGFSLSFIRHKRKRIKKNKNYAFLGRKPHERFYYITGSIFYSFVDSGDITLRGFSLSFLRHRRKKRK